jgi:hypothetical protein
MKKWLKGVCVAVIDLLPLGIHTILLILCIATLATLLLVSVDSELMVKVESSMQIENEIIRKWVFNACVATSIIVTCYEVILFLSALYDYTVK